MKIVYAYNAAGGMKNFKKRPALVGITGRSFDSFFAHMKEGDNATIEVPGQGYKTISITNGEHFIQRHYAMEY